MEKRFRIHIYIYNVIYSQQTEKIFNYCRNIITKKNQRKKSATTVSKRIELPLLSILETVVVQLACRKKFL